jgi:hypothetical protein
VWFPNWCPPGVSPGAPPMGVPQWVSRGPPGLPPLIFPEGLSPGGVPKWGPRGGFISVSPGGVLQCGRPRGSPRCGGEWFSRRKSPKVVPNGALLGGSRRYVPPCCFPQGFSRKRLACGPRKGVQKGCPQWVLLLVPHGGSRRRGLPLLVPHGSPPRLSPRGVPLMGPQMLLPRGSPNVGPRSGSSKGIPSRGSPNGGPPKPVYPNEVPESVVPDCVPPGGFLMGNISRALRQWCSSSVVLRSCFAGFSPRCFPRGVPICFRLLCPTIVGSQFWGTPFGDPRCLTHVGGYPLLNLPVGHALGPTSRTSTGGPPMVLPW